MNGYHAWLQQPQRGVKVSYARLEQELIDALVEFYPTNRAVHGTDDFLELANGIRALANLSPVH